MECGDLIKDLIPTRGVLVPQDRPAGECGDLIKDLIPTLSEYGTVRLRVWNGETPCER